MGTLAEGIKEIFETAKTTGSNVMLCGNDGTPDGHMTMDNLASVLGGLFTSIPSGADANDYKKSGKYYIGQGITNLPTFALEEPIRCILIVEEHLEYVTQTLYDVVYSHNRVFQRCCDKKTWSSWAEISFNIPSFYKDYNDLSSLSSAIGGLMYTGNREDANFIGTYFTTTYSMNNKHFPKDGLYWTLISIGDNIIKLCFQIAFDPYGEAYFRYYWNGWGSWRAL